jgi:hypothetical protein
MRKQWNSYSPAMRLFRHSRAIVASEVPIAGLFAAATLVDLQNRDFSIEGFRADPDLLSIGIEKEHNSFERIGDQSYGALFW